jgi:hypothetical protein
MGGRTVDGLTLLSSAVRDPRYKLFWIIIFWRSAQCGPTRVFVIMRGRTARKVFYPNSPVRGEVKCPECSCRMLFCLMLSLSLSISLSLYLSLESLNGLCFVRTEEEEELVGQLRPCDNR